MSTGHSVTQKLFYTGSSTSPTQKRSEKMYVYLSWIVLTLSLCMDNVLFCISHNKKKIKECYIINLIIFLAKFHIHKCTHSKLDCLKFELEAKQYITSITLYKNKKTVKTIRYMHLIMLCFCKNMCSFLWLFSFFCFIVLYYNIIVFVLLYFHKYHFKN